MSESEVVVVLCTDLVDSTGLSVRLGEEGADTLRQQLFSTTYDTVHGTGGEDVKSRGDGVMAFYRSVVSALDAAITVQRAVERLNHRRDGEPVRIRIGLSAGEAMRDDEDWFGVPVVEAARLCDAAPAGGVLANALVVALSGNRGGHEFIDRGTRLLKGFDDAVPVVEVAWSTDEPPQFALPFELERRSEQRFVGREHAVAQLEAAWNTALTGRGALALVCGEPGIGKTAAAAQLATTVLASGGMVLYGQCDEQIVASYQPFAQCLSQLVSMCDADVLAAHVAKWEGTLLPLVPELRQRVLKLSAPPLIDPQSSELHLFEACADLLRTSGESAPALLVVDDLHWANAPTLKLLAYLCRHLPTATAPLVILAMYRPTPPESALASFLSDFWADHDAVRIELRGLERVDVRTLVEHIVGSETGASAEELAETLRADTGGNPFLLWEVLRHLDDSGVLYEEDHQLRSRVRADELGTLDSIRGVMTHRLSRLSPDTREAVTVASVIGDEFDFRVLERIPDVSNERGELARALEEATAARLLVEVPGTPGRFHFAHALIRVAIVEQLSGIRRANLHGAIAEAMADAYAGDLDAHLRDLTFHYCKAAPVLDPTPGARFGVRAAQRANEQLAYADAVEITMQVVEALETAKIDEPEVRFELLAERAFALMQSGAWDDALVAQAAAVAIAGRLGSHRALARVLARQGTTTPMVGTAEAETVRVVDEALATVAPDDDWTIAALLSWRAMHGAANGEGLTSAPRARRAVDHARRINDRELEAVAHHAHCLTLLGSADISGLLEAATELQRLTESPEPGLSPFTALIGHRFVALARLIAGDRDGFERSHAAMAQLYEQTDSVFWRALLEMWDPMLALLDGNLGGVEPLVERVFANGSADPNQLLAGFSQMVALRREQGRLVEFAPTVDFAAAESPGLAAITCFQVFCRMAEGAVDVASGLLDDLARDRFAAIPRDWLFPSAAAQLSVACVELGRVDDAATLYELFLPYSGTLAVCATATYVEGAVDRFLGMLAGFLERHEVADGHFAAALELETHARSDVLAAHTRYWYARILGGTDQLKEDRREALVADSLSVARRFGLRMLDDQLRSLAVST